MPQTTPVPPPEASAPAQRCAWVIRRPETEEAAWQEHRPLRSHPPPPVQRVQHGSGRGAELVQAQQRPEVLAAFADVEMGRESESRWQPIHRFEAGFDPTRLLFEERDFWLQLSMASPFVHVPGVSARYRVHGDQQSSVFSAQRYQQMLRARQREADDAQLHARQLEQALSARDTEIEHLKLQVRALQASAAGLQRALQRHHEELAQLHAETPQRALKRTLRKALHARTKR